jgi:hypothetical protein
VTFVDIREVKLSEVRGLTSAGWVIMSHHVASVPQAMNKQYVYQASPGAYPSSHCYSEDGVVSEFRVVVGLPREVAVEESVQKLAEYEAVIMKLKDDLVMKDKSLAALTGTLAVSKTRIEALEGQVLALGGLRDAALKEKAETAKELAALRAGMAALVVKVGNVSLQELQQADAVMAEIEKAAQDNPTK